MLFQIEGYKTRSGDLPFADALTRYKSVSPKLHAKVRLYIDLIRDDQYHCMPYAEAMGQGLFMLRTRHGKHFARLFFVKAHTARIILLLNGFYKTTDKTPPDELKRARKLQCEINL
jgi:phage-related protein